LSRGSPIVAGLSVLGLLVSGIMTPVNALVRPGQTTRVDVSSDGTEPKQSVFETESTRRTALSGNGRYVAFTSAADDLVLPDTNLGDDVFVHDRLTDETEMVSVSSMGIQGKAPGCPPDRAAEAFHPSISRNGRFVAFSSCAADLVPGDTNLSADVFLHDQSTGETERVSVASDGSESLRGGGVGWGATLGTAISATGRFVAFDSDLAGLVEGDSERDADVFVRDRKAKETTLISDGSVTAGALWSNATGRFPSITPDARYVAYQAQLLGGVYVYDRQTDTTELIAGPDGANGVTLSQDWGQAAHTISDDGRFVAFISTRANLVPNDGTGGATSAVRCQHHLPAGCYDVFVRDRVTERTERVSVTSAGAEFEHQATASDKTSGNMGISLSGDGRYVAFASFADLVPDDDYLFVSPVSGGEVSDPDVYVYDRKTGAQELASRASGGEKAGECSDPGSVAVTSGFSKRNEFEHAYGVDLSADGRFVSFVSCAYNLIEGHSLETWDNALGTYVRDRGTALGAFRALSGISSGKSGRLCVETRTRFCLAPGGYLEKADRRDDVDHGLTRLGANLRGLTLAYRPPSGDLFARIGLEDMPSVGGASPADPLLLYGVEFSVSETRYQIRAQRLSSEADGGASFGLFRCNNGAPLCNKVASLEGGYGTTGKEVVVSIPLDALRLEESSTLDHIRAFSALGTYFGGPAQLIDQAVL
jgi:hypothetical protein